MHAAACGPQRLCKCAAPNLAPNRAQHPLAQGGANAGHTIYDDKGTKYALHLIPSGVLNK